MKTTTKGFVTVNGEDQSADGLEADTPLLWYLRDTLGLAGTKFGCGGGHCGACTVHLGGQPVRSCQVPVSAVIGRAVTTIEGLAGDDGRLHPLQQAWIDEDVPQCGYCQAGQIMTAAALLKRNNQPNERDIDAAMSGNLCRCGTYVRIRRAIAKASRADESRPDVTSRSTTQPERGDG